MDQLEKILHFFRKSPEGEKNNIYLYTRITPCSTEIDIHHLIVLEHRHTCRQRNTSLNDASCPNIYDLITYLYKDKLLL